MTKETQNKALENKIRKLTPDAINTMGELLRDQNTPVPTKAQLFPSNCVPLKSGDYERCQIQVYFCNDCIFQKKTEETCVPVFSGGILTCNALPV